MTPDNAGDIRDTGSIPGLGRSPEEGSGNLVQYSSLENSTDRGVWWTTICGFAELDMTECTHIYTQELENMRICINLASFLSSQINDKVHYLQVTI